MENIKATFKDGIFEGEYMWVFDNRIQAICKVNIYSYKMEIITKYKGKERFDAEQIFNYQNNFYLVAKNSAQILIYNRRKQEGDFGFVLLKPSVNNGVGRYTAFWCDNNIYFFPKMSDRNIICFNVFTKKYCEKVFLNSYMKNKIGENDYIIRYLCFYNGIVWAALYGTKYYVAYDVISNKGKLIQDANTGILVEKIYSNNYMGRKFANHFVKQQYSRLCIMDNLIAVLPKDRDEVFLIHKSTLELFIIDFSLHKVDKLWEGGINFGRCHEYNESVFFFPHAAKDLFIYDKNNHKIEKIVLRCDKYSESYFNNNREMLYEEDETINYKKLLKYLDQDSILQDDEGILKANVGKKIWEIIVS